MSHFAKALAGAPAHGVSCGLPACSFRHSRDGKNVISPPPPCFTSAQIRLADAVIAGKIRDAKTRLKHASQEALMSASNVLRFSENFDTMSYPECLAFIERSRRQIDRLEHLPQESGQVDREELASIRQGLDELERRIRSQLDYPHS
jgi:DNA-binding MurR/RpiR family transcriptional regulator